MQDLSQPIAVDSSLTDIVTGAEALGREIVDLAGFLDDVDTMAQGQNLTLEKVTELLLALSEGNDQVREAIAEVRDKSSAMVRKVESALPELTETGDRIAVVAQFVGALMQRMERIADTLLAVRGDTDQIASISTQVNILAINAKIEAARAGDAGRGFAVVAEAINELSHKTATAAKSIAGNISDLSNSVTSLHDEAGDMGGSAKQVLSGVGTMNTTMTELAVSSRATSESAVHIDAQARKVREAVESFVPALTDMSSANRTVTDNIHDARLRMNGLIDNSETILRLGVTAGGASSNARFIETVRKDAARIGTMFEEAIAKGEITEARLFDQRYDPIPGTDPRQVMAPYTALCDKLLPQVQETALEFDPKIVFCAAVDRNGYLPTHNRKFSQPQGSDPVQNAAKSRNRRIFDDRVGLKAGRNTEPFLLQVYRRDMGGGEFRMMKDLSAPILVNGRHWGGLRLAYTF